ncbi:RHS repeat domain-containing protein, partial [Chryseobacterium sp. 22532]|uniref:RHS repeat domain-containing protein n=1 Tax=Chryseobacterium sp. 22532 TaxID=3453938 RepID=UPI003F863AF9
NIEDDKWTKNFIWYDTKGRNIGSRSNNHLGGYTVVNHKLDFAGIVLQTNTYHRRLITDPEKGFVEKFTYDSQNRLLTHTHQVGSNPVEYLAQNKYNELSQLESKKVGGISLASPLQTIDYKYNIRGWMTKINDPDNLNGKLFGYSMRYQDPAIPGTSVPQYGGNIAEVHWKAANDDVYKAYHYVYDKLNRLTDAIYREAYTTAPNNYFFNESIAYDINGNITQLNRYQKPDAGTTALLIDRLNYTYIGNRLMKVFDASGNYEGFKDDVTSGGYDSTDDYAYDLNGNMIKDDNKQIISIKYNYLNLPIEIILSNNNKINYIYRADGIKLKKIRTMYNAGAGSTINETTDYLDGYQYQQSSSAGSNPLPKLLFFPTDEGYYNTNVNTNPYAPATPAYIYQYKDHIGNVRINYYKDQNTNSLIIDNESNYYPFGLEHKKYNTQVGNSNYQYKYNGKELQETGMYDYGARMYMPDLGRWGVVDPLAEKSRRWSPYTYAYNNPIRFIDPDGRSNKDIIILTANGSFKASKEILYKTAEGKRIWDKYGTSKTEDIYINSKNFGTSSSTVAEAIHDVKSMGLAKDGKVSIPSGYVNSSEFNNLDISKSGDKKVHLVSLNENYFKGNNSDSRYSTTRTDDAGNSKTVGYSNYDLAEAIYHEIKSHIEDSTGGADGDHIKYGADGFKLIAPRTPGSPAEMIMNQLIQVRDAKKNKNDKKN